MFGRVTSLFGSSLPFTVGEEKGKVWNWWTLYAGTLKENGNPVSVFKAVVPTSQTAQVDLAKNSLKRWRGLKHPSIVELKDSHEASDRSNVTLFVVTEPVMTLAEFFALDGMGGTESDLLSWGLRSIVKGVSFLNNECKFIHGNVSFHTVFVSDALDFKLGIFDLLSEHANFGKVHDPQPLMSGFEHVPPYYLPGEVHNKDWIAVADGPEWGIDAWGLGCFLQEIFRRKPLDAMAQLKEIQPIPRTLAGDYKQLLSTQPSKRSNPRTLEKNAFLKTKLSGLLEFLDSIIISDDAERARFFRSLSNSAQSLPPILVKKKILPACLSALEYGSVQSTGLQAILELVSVDQDEAYFEKHLVPFLVKMLGSKDVMVKLLLLQTANKYIPMLSNAVIESKIYQSIQSYFKDGDPRIRDQTVKFMSFIAPKMSQKTLNSSLLQHLALLQRDPEAAIRTNTTVLISKISPHLGEASCKRILLNAFTRVLNDPAPSVKIAGILALKETNQYYSEEDIARKLLPVLAPLVVDPDYNICSASYRSLESNFQKLKSYMEQREKDKPLPEPTAEAGPSSSQPPSDPFAASGPVAQRASNAGAGASVGSWSTPKAGDGAGGLMDAEDDENGWGVDDDDIFGGLAQPAGTSQPTLEGSISNQMDELMVGMGQPEAKPASPRLRQGGGAGPRQHVSLKRPPKTASKKSAPMKLGATRKTGPAKPMQGDDDPWGDLLNS